MNYIDMLHDVACLIESVILTPTLKEVHCQCQFIQTFFLHLFFAPKISNNTFKGQIGMPPGKMFITY